MIVLAWSTAGNPLNPRNFRQQSRQALDFGDGLEAASRVGPESRRNLRREIGQCVGRLPIGKPSFEAPVVALQDDDAQGTEIAGRWREDRPHEHRGEQADRDEALQYSGHDDRSPVPDALGLTRTTPNHARP